MLLGTLLKILNLCCSLRMRYEVFHLYKTTGKFIVVYFNILN